MTKDDIRPLFEYDRWANTRVMQSVAKLSAEQFTRDLGGSFRSVRDTLVHLIGGEWIWLQYWKAKSLDVKFIADLQERRNRLFAPEAYPTSAGVQAKWAEVEREQREFVEGITDQSLEGLLPFRTTWVKLSELMQHVANHSTYHRGQIALMMRQLGSEPAATDFHVFLVEGRTETPSS
jgi:uncharacterized damage-inducible protein DinB